MKSPRGVAAALVGGVGRDGRGAAGWEIQGSLQLAGSRACRIKELNVGLRSGLLHPLSSGRIT